MHVVYRLNDDLERIERVQNATLTTTEYGLEVADALFGLPEWWERIRDGSLPTHTLAGTIVDVYMSGHNDFPGFDMRTDGGEVTSWARDANSPAMDGHYEVGRRIELDYVIQRFRSPRLAADLDDKVVLEIRVGDD